MHCFKAGAQLNETTSDSNPCTAHLNPQKLMKPDTQILLMLLAAGGELENELFLHDNSLKDAARKFIRKQLKRFHPRKNLYSTIPLLGLPDQMRSYLLFYTLLKIEPNLMKNETDLLLKTSKADTETVLSLIEAGVDVNIQDENGMTALMIAAQTGQVELVEAFIKAEANMNIRTCFGDTALICATMKKQKNSVNKLLEFGANVNIQGQYGQTALFHAAKKKDEESLKALLQCNANPDIKDNDGKTILETAIITKNSENVSKLIKAGADVNLPGTGGTPSLIAAIHLGPRGSVKELITAGADVNKCFGCTALMFAAHQGFDTSVQELIRAGADLNIQIDNETALTLANFPKCLRLLYEAGAEVNTKHLANTAREIMLFRYMEGIVI